MKSWLNDYAYRTNLGIPVFLLAAAVAFLIAQFTVSFQAIKAARTNPADSIRYE
jgi:putative ABC transport system permease protein